MTFFEINDSCILINFYAKIYYCVLGISFLSTCIAAWKYICCMRAQEQCVSGEAQIKARSYCKSNIIIYIIIGCTTIVAFVCEIIVICRDVERNLLISIFPMLIFINITIFVIRSDCTSNCISETICKLIAFLQIALRFGISILLFWAPYHTYTIKNMPLYLIEICYVVCGCVMFYYTYEKLKQIQGTN